MKKYLIALILIVLGSLGFGYFLYNKPHAETAGSKADFILTPTALMNNYDLDEAKSDSLYLDKIIEVTGTIKDINISESGGSLTLNTGSDMSSIIGEFEDATSLKDLKQGDEVTIKGFCTGKLMDIILTRCSLK